MRGYGWMLRQVDANADDFLEQRAIWKLPVDELLLALGQVAERRRLSEDVLEDFQTDSRLVVRRRYEDAARRLQLRGQARSARRDR